MSAFDAVNRPSTREERGRLKLATKASLLDAGTAAELVRENMVRVGEAALSRASVHSTANDEHFVGIDTALDLDRLAGEPRHARALAELQGWTLTPLAALTTKDPIGAACVNRLARAFNAVDMELREATEDGVLTAAEAAEALEVITNAEVELATKKARLLRLVRSEAAS